MRSVVLSAILLLALSQRQPLLAQTSAGIATNSPTPLSTRVVDYAIDAHINTTQKSVDATESLTYHNLTGQPLTTFPFHLYLNAFRPESTFTSETHFGGGVRDSESASDYPARKLGAITLTSLSADTSSGTFGNILPLLHFTAPDDNNQNDHTVAELNLPRPIAPGESITFHIAFHDQFPESVARNGYKRDFLMGGQWYPKLGVFWHGAWNCHQYHATTEFFSDFATFRVHLTLPRNYTVGASGVPTGDQANSDGTRTLSFYGEDIHDFAWAASPHFTVTNGTYLSSMGPVQVRVLALSENPEAGPRYLKILLASLDQFDRRFGPYPYKILTLIDPEPGSEMSGMEYPTLVTGDYSEFDPSLVTEITAEHEFGHQYWYGMVATNEFEDAWLDEGINSYTELNVLGDLLGRDRSAIRFPWASASDEELQYSEYIAEPDYDPVTRHAWQFRNAASYGGVTYGKSGTLLKTLEGLIGPDVMAEAMRTYFMRYRFTHPTTENFLTTLEEVAIRHGRATPGLTIPGASSVSETDAFGQRQVSTLYTQPDQYHLLFETTDRPGPAAIRQMLASQPTISVGSSLRPFLNQAVYGTQVLDYAIDAVHSDPAQWWKPASGQTQYRDTVSVHRIGDFRMPVTLEVTFTDGAKLRETWDASRATQGENDRWHTFTWTRNAKIASAEIDPGHILLLDRDRFNNSFTVAANPTPARKLSTLYASGLQLLSQFAGWIV
jgi:hypothetical protein